MKKLLCILLAALCLLTPCAAVDAGLIDAFFPGLVYRSAFSDVGKNDWFFKEVNAAAEMSLIEGKGEKLFKPNEELTVAEAVTLAARARQLYEDGEITLKNGSVKWYSAYVSYAEKQNIISAGDFSDYDAKITRGEMAEIFAAALPASEYKAINELFSIPDVSARLPCYTSVLKLLRAGVVQGKDENGNFKPGDTLKRSEIAAVLIRLLDTEYRIVLE